ncbi:hypothetical protein C8R47DRAFT_1212800 [Mycena vitilis]|nr:hypothetical protein C8R47DRAFT_1212800 [Mycena vitilis]
MAGPTTAPVATHGAARFTRPRLACLAGYLDFPTIYSGMSFDLRHLPRITSRVVRVDGHVYELWSPNSQQFPYLSDFLRSDYTPSIPPEAEKRYDGHAGKHDCLHSPQYRQKNAQHWPFMRRASMVSDDNYAALAFAPLSQYWRCDDLDNHRGSFDTSFVDGLISILHFLDRRMEKFHAFAERKSSWESRPTYSSEEKILKLLDVRVWDDAVDLGVAVQRGLREKEAWTCLMDAQERQQTLPLKRLKEQKIPLAREKFVGLWINGLQEEATLRLMLARVPCFIVHEYPSTARARDEIGGARTFRDFLEGTEVSQLLGDHNPYQQLAHGQILLDKGGVDDDGRTLPPFAPAVDRMRSSSLYLEQPPLLAGPPSAPPATTATCAASGFEHIVSAPGSAPFTPVFDQGDPERGASRQEYIFGGNELFIGQKYDLDTRQPVDDLFGNARIPPCPQSFA